MKNVLTYIIPSILFCFFVFSDTDDGTKNSFWEGQSSYFSITIVEKPDGEFAASRLVMKGNEGVKRTYPAHTYKGTDGYVTVDYGYGMSNRIIQFKILSRDSNAMVCQLDNEDTPLRGKRNDTFTLHKRR